MPSFVYRAVDVEGRLVNGSLEGETEADCVRALERRQLTALTMRRARSRRDAETGRAAESEIRLSTDQVMHFTRQIKVMLATGATLLSALALLHRKAKGGYRRLLECISADIQRGATLSESLAGHPRCFSPFYIGTIRAGEAGGVQTEALEELVQYYERRIALRRDVIGALTYPSIVLATLVAAAIVMLAVVVPQFEGLFRASRVELPLATRMLLGTSKAITQHGDLLGLGAAAAGVMAWRLRRSATLRSAILRSVAALPFVGRVVYLGSVIQFARMVSLLERAGLPLLEVLRIVEDALHTGPVRAMTARLRRAVVSGESLSAAAAETGALPEIVETALVVGESSGTIDETLATAATHYEAELRATIKRLTTALEPLLTLVVSGLVLVMALAIFMPLWEMNSVMLKN